jgi:predicted lipid-binding transport protein (Tim44 family)
MTENDPKIQVDTDWKAEARAEKERLAREAEATESRRRKPRRGEAPRADFGGLVGALASQAITGLGALVDSRTGAVIIDLPGAKFAIDLLGVLEEKTRGNLTPQEAEELTQILAELRAQFVRLTEAVGRQQAAEAAAAAAGRRWARGSARARGCCRCGRR